MKILFLEKENNELKKKNNELISDKLLLIDKTSNEIEKMRDEISLLNNNIEYLIDYIDNNIEPGSNKNNINKQINELKIFSRAKYDINLKLNKNKELKQSKINLLKNTQNEIQKLRIIIKKLSTKMQNSEITKKQIFIICLYIIVYLFFFIV